MIIRDAEVEVGKVYYTYPWSIAQTEKGDLFMCASFTCFSEPHGDAQLAFKKFIDSYCKVMYDKNFDLGVVRKVKYSPRYTAISGDVL